MYGLVQGDVGILNELDICTEVCVRDISLIILFIETHSCSDIETLASQNNIKHENTTKGFSKQTLGQWLKLSADILFSNKSK